MRPCRRTPPASPTGPAAGKLLAGALALFALSLAGCGDTGESPERAPSPAPLSVARLLGGGSEEADGFARATEPREFRFPADHGPHPELRTEWWYFTGHLAADRPFGFQLTFFRNALAPPGEIAPRESAWAAGEVYLGHFALTDIAGGEFHSFERFARSAAGLAGAQTDPFRVWVGPWSITGPRTVWPLRLQAAGPTDDGAQVALDLLVEPPNPVRGPVLQGEAGLSPKGPEPGNASYYYSLPRLAAHGSVTLSGETYAVQGEAWLDREWSTSALGPDLAGWDWFSLQLADAQGRPRELMVYQLRRHDGEADAFSDGRWILDDGSSRRLEPEDFRITVLDRWTSPVPSATGKDVVYPSRWRLEVPSENLDLLIEPRLADQELRLSVRYWEGAVEVTGTAGGEPIAGLGYVELTGYADIIGPSEGTP